jgi:hypothetical protein
MLSKRLLLFVIFSQVLKDDDKRETYDQVLNFLCMKINNIPI